MQIGGGRLSDPLHILRIWIQLRKRRKNEAGRIGKRLAPTLVGQAQRVPLRPLRMNWFRARHHLATLSADPDDRGGVEVSAYGPASEPQALAWPLSTAVNALPLGHLETEPQVRAQPRFSDH